MVLLIITCTCKCFDIINFQEVASLPAKCTFSDWVSPDNNCGRPTNFCIQCTVVYVCQKTIMNLILQYVRPCMLSAHPANMLILGQCWANVGPKYTLRWDNVAHQLWTNVVLLIGPTEVTPTICQRSANVEPALEQRKSVGLYNYVGPPMSDANKFCPWLGVVLSPLQYRIDTLYKPRHVSSTLNFNAHHSVVQ